MLERSGIAFKMIEQLDADFLEDPVATLGELERAIHDIIHDKSTEKRTIVVDGVSDIRKFATQEWIYRDNQDRKRKGIPQRETISGENKSAWADINDRVKRILRPLINWANVTRNNVFFTAQMKDNYLNDKKVGKAINIGDWCEYDVDVKIEFFRPSLEHYKIRITKMPDWANDDGVFEYEIDKNGLLPILIQKGLVR